MNLNTGKFAIGAALTLAVVVASSSTTVLAMTVLPKDSVGQSQLQAGAVTTQKIHKHAVTGSQVQQNTFVKSAQMAFGKGSAASKRATTILKLPRINAVVTTDGTASTDPNVVVRLPKQQSFVWVFQIEGEDTFSTKGGRISVGAPSLGNTLSATIWRSDNAKELYLHCAFDTTGFTTKRPVTCWAVSN